MSQTHFVESDALLAIIRDEFDETREILADTSATELMALYEAGTDGALRGVHQTPRVLPSPDQRTQIRGVMSTDDTDLSWEAALDLAASDRDALAEELRTTPAASNHAKTYPRRWQVMRQQSNTVDRPMPSRWWHRFGPLAEWHAHWLSNRELARGVFYTAYRPPEQTARSAMVRAVGWGFIPLPGEQKRLARAEREARELLRLVEQVDSHAARKDEAEK